MNDVLETAQSEINREVHQALYGNPETGDPGLVKNMNKIVSILGAFELFGKAVMWIALVAGSVGAAVEGFLHLFLHGNGK